MKQAMPACFIVARQSPVNLSALVQVRGKRHFNRTIQPSFWAGGAGFDVKLKYVGRQP